jgi:hypothetical protein
MTWIHRLRTAPLISLLLLVLAARALVPVGFMPASDGSAELTLCPAGMVMPAGSPMADHGGHFQTDRCPFGSAPFAAPITAIAVIPFLAAAISLPLPSLSPVVVVTRAARGNPPRGPPV